MSELKNSGVKPQMDMDGHRGGRLMKRRAQLCAATPHAHSIPPALPLSQTTNLRPVKTMKTPLHIHLALLAAALAGGTLALHAQGFDAGSDGTLGDVVIDANTTLPLPPDGKLHYKSLKVNSGVRLNFTRNARNTPVSILSQGAVVVDGTIDVSGGASPNNSGGLGGPGGFDGGRPGFGAEVPPGDGYGPGGGKGGVGNCDPNSANGVGSGSYGSRQNQTRSGPTYGGSLLIPMVGGSGGGGLAGQPGFGGGGGGGAILISANTRIAVAGAIVANGGGGSGGCGQHSGSGGAIRLVAFKVEGTGQIQVLGGPNGGNGRIRVDTIDRASLQLVFRDNAQTTVGGNLLSFPPVVPRLDTIEVAGNAVPVGGNPATFILPFGSTPNRTVKIQASDFGRLVPIRITLTPDTGERVTVDAEVDNTAAGSAVLDVPVVMPVNTLVTVHCWTR